MKNKFDTLYVLSTLILLALIAWKMFFNPDTQTSELLKRIEKIEQHLSITEKQRI
jgi:hypothetical protein